MPTPTADVRSEPRTHTDLVLEAIALRHQIGVLKRSGTRRPCFRLWDRLFWIFLSWWWPNWHESLLIVQPATVQRWRRNGWSGLWRYRSRGRWRGGRPKVSREVRCLITRMARENFLWGAPRIHGELLMLGFQVSQATVSRYLSTSGRSRGQSWRTFIRNQAIAFSDKDNPEYEYAAGDLGLSEHFGGGRPMHFGAGIARLEAAPWISHEPIRPRRHSEGRTERPGLRARGALLRVQRLGSPSGRTLKSHVNPFLTEVQMRGPPHHAPASSKLQ